MTHRLITVALASLAITLPAAAQSVASITAPDYRPALVVYEGIRDEPYRDRNGSWVVGIGHSLTANRERVKPRYTRDEIAAFYDHDLATALRSARLLVKGFDEMPDGVKEVCVHLIFTCGPSGFARFKDFRFCIEHSMWHSAASRLKDSRWARQVSRPRRDWALDLLERL
jgi:GH24 family phage-related lysozyme (muramidase)